VLLDMDGDKILSYSTLELVDTLLCTACFDSILWSSASCSVRLLWWESKFKRQIQYMSKYSRVVWRNLYM